MSPDHLYEEGLAEFEEIEVPFSIIFLLFILLTISYVIHFKRHFYIFGLLARMFSGYMEVGQQFRCDILLAFYFMFQLQYKTQRKLLDSTQSRD